MHPKQTVVTKDVTAFVLPLIGDTRSARLGALTIPVVRNILNPSLVRSFQAPNMDWDYGDGAQGAPNP